MRGAAAAIILSALSTLSEAAFAAPLDKPNFTAKPAELLAEVARLAPSDDGVVVLRDDIAVDIDDAGRATHRYRIVFVVRTADAVDTWATMQTEWSPYYQHKPTVRARVMTAPDQVAELDQRLVTDTAVAAGANRRTLDAPLPQLAIGAVVEEEFTIVDREALPGGIASHEAIGRAVPVLRTTVSLSAPTTQKLRVNPRGFAKLPVPLQSTHGGRTTWRFDVGPQGILYRAPEGLPADVAAVPSFGYSTAPSWTVVAATYRQLLERTLAGFTLPTELQHASIDRILAWQRAHLATLAIDLAQGELVPTTPAAILARGTGDAKDAAWLLVALLRAAGYTADLALLDAGPDLDLDPALPGFGELDHALVRAQVDGKDLWIDPSEDALPAGVLPIRDRGRHTLVIAATTKELVRTPIGTSTDTVIHKLRTFRAAEAGRSTVTEVITETGHYANNQRVWVRDGTADDLRAGLQTYVEQQYDGHLVKYANSDPADLAHPFALTIEADNVQRVFTNRESLVAYLYPTDALPRLPEVLEEAQPLERTLDYVWSAPHVTEIETRILLPEGYAPPTLTAHELHQLGTMSISVDRKIDGNAIVIKYRGDTGKLRITGAELEATRAALHQLRETGEERIELPQTGAKLFAAHMIKEAVAEYERLIALHPQEPLHLDQLADLYRQIGMGPAARRTARKAVTLAPDVSDAHDMLAWELAHDSLGRTYTPDCDRKGAIAEYRKALELNPKHLGGLADLAELLAHDASGRPTENAAERVEAIGLWRRAKEVSNTDDYDVTIVTELLRAGDLVTAEAEATKLPVATPDRSKLLVTAVAAARGVKVATLLVSGDEGAEILRGAGDLLLQMRRYDLARAMVAASGLGDANWMRSTEHLAPIELAKLDPADPRTVARRSFALLLDGDREVAPAVASPQTLVDLEEQLAGVHDKIAAWRTMPRRLQEDTLAALGSVNVDGDPRFGWHAVLDVGTGPMPFYVASVNHRAVLLGTSDAPTELGHTLLALLAKGDTNGAARWLDWFARDPHANLRLRIIGTLFQDAAAHGTPSKDELATLAAMLIVAQDPKTALPLLERCALKVPNAATACALDQFAALRALDKWSETIALAHRFSETDALWPSAIGHASRARLLSGDAKGALTTLDDALAKRADDHELLQHRAQISLRAEGWEVAKRWFERLVGLPDRNAHDLNNAAWFTLFYDPNPDAARKLAAIAEGLSAVLPANLANTIATIEAEAGRPDNALAYLLRGLDTYADLMPHDGDYYVIGRIAEGLGLKDDAITAYRKVPKTKQSEVGPTAWTFAERALARLGAK